MKGKSFFYGVLLSLSVIGFVDGQEKVAYTLEECIDLAIKNNLNLKTTKFSERSAKINYQQSWANMLPSINGNYNIGVNNGRSIDPFTNDFINQRLVFSNANLNLDATIFNGFRLLNTIKQNRLNSKAASLEVEQEKQNLVLSVTLAYLQVLNSRDVLVLNKQRLEATNDQIKIQKDLYDQGRENPADYTDLLGQKSLDETNILNSEIALNSAELELGRLLNLSNNIDVNAKNMLLNREKYQLSSDQVYQDALNSLATFKARELRVKAAKRG